MSWSCALGTYHNPSESLWAEAPTAWVLWNQTLTLPCHSQSHPMHMKQTPRTRMRQGEETTTQYSYTFEYPTWHQSLNASFKVIIITVLAGKDHQSNSTLINTSGVSHWSATLHWEETLHGALALCPAEGHSYHHFCWHAPDPTNRSPALKWIIGGTHYHFT